MQQARRSLPHPGQKQAVSEGPPPEAANLEQATFMGGKPQMGIPHNFLERERERDREEHRSAKKRQRSMTQPYCHAARNPEPCTLNSGTRPMAPAFSDAWEALRASASNLCPLRGRGKGRLPRFFRVHLRPAVAKLGQDVDITAAPEPTDPVPMQQSRPSRVSEPRSTDSK